MNHSRRRGLCLYKGPPTHSNCTVGNRLEQLPGHSDQKNCTKDLSGGLSRSWSRLSSCITTMRNRSGSTQADGVRRASVPENGGRFIGGRLMNLFRSPRAPTPVNNIPTQVNITDGGPSHTREEPKPVVRTFEENLEGHHLCEASRQLIEREERLFGEIREASALKHHEVEVDRLCADRRTLEGNILDTLRLSLTPGSIDIKALTSAVKAINQEEAQDQEWNHRSQTPPRWRPCSWRNLHDSTLRSLVEECMDSPSTPPPDQVKQSSIQTDINSMGRQLKEDLLFVVEVVKLCYPSEMDICNCYAKMFHQTFSSRLRKIADFVLEDKDCSFLLRWVNDYYPGILQKPEFVSEIDAEVLGKLLPEELLQPLEKQYLSRKQDELTTYISRVLEEEKQKWSKGEGATREDGYFSSPVAYDIIQFISGMVTSSEKVVGDWHKAQIITSQLNDLMQSFRTFQNDIIRQNKSNSRSFIKANLGCIEQFIDVLDKKRHFYPLDVQKDCLQVLKEMRESANVFLLKPVHDRLKSTYQPLGTNKWLNKPLFENLLVSIENELQDLEGLIPSCQQRLVGQLHQEVTVEYVRRLLKGKVKLKDREQQTKAYTIVMENAESLHNLFQTMGSEEDWLKEILTKIAEVLKLQDLPAIQMQVAALGTAFPDLSDKHVSALLKLKTNLSKSDRKTVKETLLDTLNEANSDGDRPFFSLVQVK